MATTTTTPVTETAAATGPVYGMLAEFHHGDDLMAAIAKIRAKGYTKLEAFTPFPIHGIDDALGEKRSPLGYITFCGGATGFTFGAVLQWWSGAVNYQHVIGGKPLFAFPPSIPVMFESTVLFSAFTAIIGMIVLNGLPRFNHPLFNYSRHAGISDDKFVLAVKASDPKYDEAVLQALFEEVGAKHAEVVRADA